MIPAWKPFLSQKITTLKGIGEEKARLFAEELKVDTLGDLLYLFPLRYVDKTKFKPINELKYHEGETVYIKGILKSLNQIGSGAKRRVMATFRDDTGSLQLVWFRGGYYAAKSLKVGNIYTAYGKVNLFNKRPSIAHPELTLEGEEASTFEPVYPSTEKFNAQGVSMKIRRRMVAAVLREIESRFPDSLDNIPESLCKKYKLLSHLEALKSLHFPVKEGQSHNGSRRIKFEELFHYHLRQQLTKITHDREIKGFPIRSNGELYNKFVSEFLPFKLTNAQENVLEDIAQDISSGKHMNRLIQGDVGSGKTIVALLAMLMALDSGYQACLMAPTQILAQQHYEGLQELLKGTGVMIAFLTGSTKTSQRKKILAALERGDLDIIVGTHALIEDPVVFKRLGIAVIDEQHRFGVRQRARLWRKSKPNPPHVLVMTATPIPRTLALTSYAELDISKIDELPPGRKPVLTKWVKRRDREKVYEWIRQEILKGRQVYVVYPLVEESEVLDLKDVTNGYENLKDRFPNPEFEVVMVHGKMKPADKDVEMAKFSSGKAQIMVATTVIEVGVNVPNASVMMIENAERFGLSQLHQLRGRVGRGENQSYCILMTDSNVSEYSAQRLKIMCDTNDGFIIAEKDLELRGAGDIEGFRQSGQMNFQLAKLPEDQVIFDIAFEEALKVLLDDPSLEQEENKGLRHHNDVIGYVKSAWAQIS